MRSIVAAGGIDDGEDVRVAHRAAGLDEGADARLEARLDRVGEREERVRARTPRRPCVRRRGTRGPWRPPGAPHRPATSGRCPMPISRPSRTRTIAFEVTPRTSRQARSRSRRSASVGARRVAHGPGRGVVGDDVRRAYEDRAAGGPDRPERRGAAAGRIGSSAARASSMSTRRFGLRREDASASSSNAGATTTSRKIASVPPRPRRSTGRVSATTPPNALTGSAGQGGVPGARAGSAAPRRRTGSCA